MRKRFLTAALIGCLPTLARAAGAPDRMMAMKGFCDKLVVSGQDLSKTCDGKIINTIYIRGRQAGRTGFYFFGRDVVLTFSGQAKQIKPDPNSAVQPLDEIIISYKGQTDPIITAVGTCKFNNPYEGPSYVVCHAETEHGDFDGQFLSDGGEPATIK